MAQFGGVRGGGVECIYVCDMGSLPSRANPIKLGGLGAALVVAESRVGHMAPAIVLITFQMCDEENSHSLMNEPRAHSSYSRPFDCKNKANCYNVSVMPCPLVSSH